MRSSSGGARPPSPASRWRLAQPRLPTRTAASFGIDTRRSPPVRPRAGRGPRRRLSLHGVRPSELPGDARPAVTAWGQHTTRSSDPSAWRFDSTSPDGNACCLGRQRLSPLTAWRAVRERRPRIDYAPGMVDCGCSGAARRRTLPSVWPEPSGGARTMTAKRSRRSRRGCRRAWRTGCATSGIRCWSRAPWGPPRQLACGCLGEDLVLWRDRDGHPHALADHCPHRWARLSLGRVLGGDLQCAYHGLRFDGRGQCVLVPWEPDGGPPPEGMVVLAFGRRARRAGLGLPGRRERLPTAAARRGGAPGEATTPTRATP